MSNKRMKQLRHFIHSDRHSKNLDSPFVTQGQSTAFTQTPTTQNVRNIFENKPYTQPQTTTIKVLPPPTISTPSSKSSTFWTGADKITGRVTQQPPTFGQRFTETVTAGLVQPKPNTFVDNTNTKRLDTFTNRVNKLDTWQTNIATRQQRAEDVWKNIPGLSGPSGTTWGQPGYFKEAARSTLAVPGRLVTTMPETLALYGGKVAAVGEALTIPEARKNILPTLGSAALQTPSAMVQAVNPKTPQGLVNLGLTATSMYMLGKARTPTPESYQDIQMRGGKLPPLRKTLDAVRSGDKPMTAITAGELKYADTRGLKVTPYRVPTSSQLIDPSSKFPPGTDIMYFITKKGSGNIVPALKKDLQMTGVAGEINTGKMFGYKPWEIRDFVTRVAPTYPKTVTGINLEESYYTNPTITNTALRQAGISPVPTELLLPTTIPDIVGTTPINRTRLMPAEEFKNKFLKAVTAPVTGVYTGITTPTFNK